MSQRRQSETTVTLPRFVVFLPTLLDGLAIKAIRAVPAWQTNPKPIVVWRRLARGAQPRCSLAEWLLVGLNQPGL